MKNKTFSYNDIQRLTRNPNYRINVDWDALTSLLNRWQNEYRLCKLDLDPEFQRGHVWTEEQQRAYVEFKLKGGNGSNTIIFNCIGWRTSFAGPFVLVDGKQRLTAVIKFLNDDLTVFGGYKKSEITGRIKSDIDFIFCVNDLPTMNDVYKWYVELNESGTPHTQEEIDKVKKMIKE